MLRKIFHQSSAALLLTLLIFSSAASVSAQLVCLPSGSPVTISGSLTASDAAQTGRIMRDSRPSTCRGKTNGLQNSNAVKYDVQTFTNPTGQNVCVTVKVNFSGCGFNDTEAVAYSSYNPANPAANVIGDLGFSTFERGSFSFPVNAGGSFSIVVHEITPNSGCANYTYTLSYATGCRQPGFDRNNDGKADLGMYTADGTWKTLDLTNDATTATSFGIGTDIPLAGDFSGDGRTDLAVFRPSAGNWYVLSTPANSFSAVPWGAAGDTPLTGDFDGDKKADYAVFRPSNGAWYVLRSSDNTLLAYSWGANGDKAVSGDFDGDSVTDFAVYRPDLQGYGVWFVQNSNFNNSFYTIDSWGLPTDIPVPADYDGDGRTDLAIYRPENGLWCIVLSSGSGANPYSFFSWGTSGDIPQPADYDGDGKTDCAVYRPADQKWYILSTSSGIIIKQFGAPGDKPVTAPQN